MKKTHVCKQYSINSSAEINENLRLIRYKTNSETKEILSPILAQLAQIIIDKETPCGFISYVQGDKLITQTYGMGNMTFSGKATAPLNQILGVA